MMRPCPDLDKLIEVRARAAMAKNPAIAPRFLAEQSGMQLGAAIAWLQRVRGDA